jgi:hypothetical protein
VQVLIWRSFKSSTTKVYTETIDLSRMTDAAELKAKLVMPEYMRLETGQPSDVGVKLNAITDKTDAIHAPQPGGR